MASTKARTPKIPQAPRRKEPASRIQKRWLPYAIGAAVTFEQVSLKVGGSVMALDVTPGGKILAGDMQRGLLASPDGGKTWKGVLNAQLAGLAINPSNPQQILAAGPGIFRSVDAGNHWKQVARIDAGVGPVAWSPSNPRLAFAVGFDRVLYHSKDSGLSWSPVA